MTGHRGPKFDRRQTDATIGKKSYVRYHSWHGFMGLKALAMQGRCMQQLTRVSLKQKKIEKLVPAVQAVYFGMRGT